MMKLSGKKLAKTVHFLSGSFSNRPFEPSVWPPNHYSHASQTRVSSSIVGVQHATDKWLIFLGST